MSVSFRSKQKVAFITAWILGIGFVLAPNQKAEAGFFRDLHRRVVTVVSGLPVPSNPVLQVLTQTINLFTDCDESSVDGIKTHCIDATSRNNISAGVQVLKARQYLIDRGGATDPYYHFKNHTRHMVNWESAQMRLTYPLGYLAGCTDGSALACHTLDGTTFFNSGGLALSPVKMAGLLLHEADHFNKTHSCGDSGDNDLNGAYALQIKYLLSVYWNKPWNVTVGQSSEAYSVALSYATNNLCNRLDLKNEVMQYANHSSLYTQQLIYPPPTYYPPSPTCRTCMYP